MKVVLDLSETKDRDLIVYLNSIDTPAQEYVVKQLIRIGLETDANPFKRQQPKPMRTRNEMPVHPLVEEPAFSYDNKEVATKKPEGYKPPPLQEAKPLKKKQLSKEERLKILEKKLGGI